MLAETIEFTDVFLRIIGAFYAFAGFVATRVGAMSYFLDKAIAAISAKKPSRTETAQTVWLLSAAAMVLAGGVLLLAGLQLAVFVFIASSLGQALYIYVLAPRYFDREEPADARGRRQTTNAFVIYLAATAFIAWAAWRGRLTPLGEATIFELATVGAALLLYAGYVLRLVWWMPRQADRPAWSAISEDDTPARPLHTSQRIKLMADYGCDPIWAMDDDLWGCFPPEDLGVSEELSAAIKEWAQHFEASLNSDDPGTSTWSEADIAAHEAKGRRLVLRLKLERPDLTVLLHTNAVGVVEVHADEAT